MTSAQYPLSLSLSPVFTADNFVVSDCNYTAYQWINAWPRWHSHALLLSGPKGAGKSHLGAIWASRAKAVTRPASILDPSILPDMHGNYLIEDIERCKDERTLLHMFNNAKEQNSYLLFSSVRHPQAMSFSLPDLASRIRSLPIVQIDSPDDAVLVGILRKQFADRQLKVEEDVITYLLPRIERSFAFISQLVDVLDQASLSEQRVLTIPFVKSILNQ